MNIEQFWLNINGADRMFICDLDNDTLADVLRRIGLTGTKVGCGIGVCGACSVILNGKVTRSCTRKMKSVKQYSSVLTIEGIGSVRNLHPLQQAWITYGGVQCGFCTPGFIVSAYGLLEENPAPTRQDVRDWFTKHRNICRCTGYKPLVDAVMAAAAVMRGEMTMDDITYHHPENGEYYGSKLPRPAALSKVCGVCDYGDDIKLKMPEGTLHCAIVQPRQYSHAKIISIDTSEAEAMPGVQGVFTAKDVKGTNMINGTIMHPRRKVFNPNRPVICGEKIFRYGDVVAVVAAESEAKARAAAAKVKVELEPLPEYMNMLEAVVPDAIRIHEEAPNIYLEMPTIKGDEDTRDVLDKSAFVAEGSFYSTREPHLPIESDMVQAYWDSNGNLAVHGKAHAVYGIKMMTAKAVGIDHEKLRIIENPTGGSFGYSVSPSTYALAAVVTMATGKPCSLSLNYEEFMHFTGKRSSSYANVRLGCDGEGRLTGVEYEAGLDHGCYTESADNVLQRFGRFITWPYYCPNGRVLARTAYSNHNYGVAYRGYGMPQVMTASEGIMDILAEKAGMDPFEFRYKNIARPGDTNMNSYPFREYPMEEIMDKMRPFYREAKVRASEESTSAVKRGVGIAWGGYICTLGAADQAEIDLELNADGTVTHFNTWEDVGQGGDIGTLTVTLEALKELKLRPDQIKLVMNDSYYCPDSGVAASSRSHIMTGLATINSARQLLDAMRKDDGTFRTYEEMVAEGIPTKYRGKASTRDMDLVNLDPNTGVGDPTAFWMYALYMAEVEVDVSTGKTKVLNMVCVDDVGVVGNELAVAGQAYGGISHSIGFALTEDYEDVKKHNNIFACGVPSANDIPDDITIIHCENPRERGPFGSSGCSEAYQSGGHVAIINAIYNATGVRIYELPATAEKVKAGVDILAAGGKIEPPARYYLGENMYDTLEEMVANPV